MRIAVRRLGMVLPLLVLAACGSTGPKTSAVSSVPSDGPQVIDDDGAARQLAVRVCRSPDERAPAPLAIINHGAPSQAENIPRMQPTGCDSEPARWFMARGFVVVFALRRGFGLSDGAIAEESGPCEAPDYRHAGEEAARDIDAIVRWSEALPGVRRDATVVVGQSTGGWAALAYAARRDQRAAAVINMAGGRDRRAFDAPETYCHPETLVAAAASYGSTARVPTLWVYASNDGHFTPALVARMEAAFAGAGGIVDFAPVPPFGADGHQLFYAPCGSRVWGPVVERFLRQTLPRRAPGLS
jgi:pimeloyl-ACP methyl ester carboxylesterase